ncbi:hypothetical protein SDC9_108444 [bioreactor metagenome]|uniref:Uncharacterized protein n=1 Tax=bioreactor metagenome TaxID=1076179 RepID=A0A645BIM2_9ZZZZ
MNFISIARRIALNKRKRALPRFLSACQRGGYGQNSEPGQRGYIPFHTVRVVHLYPHHLISSTNAVNRFPGVVVCENNFFQAFFA